MLGSPAAQKARTIEIHIDSALDPLNLSRPRAAPRAPKVEKAILIEATETAHFWARAHSSAELVVSIGQLGNHRAQTDNRGCQKPNPKGHSAVHKLFGVHGSLVAVGFDGSK